MSKQALEQLLQNKENKQDEYLQTLLANWHIFDEIFEACGKRFHHGCGSYLFDGQTYKYDPTTLPKQRILYNLAKHATDVMELGVYLGHSLFIMLLANPKLKITCVDFEDQFAAKAIAVLERHFKTKIRFIKSDSKLALEELVKDSQNRWDMFHIDATHSPEAVSKEFALCVKMKKETGPTVFVFDDYDYVRGAVDPLLKLPNVQNITIPEKCSYRNCSFILS